jgi:hypothetical protein
VHVAVGDLALGIMAVRDLALRVCGLVGHGYELAMPAAVGRAGISTLAP